MPTLQRISKPKTQRGKNYLLDREPKTIENIKQTLFIKGRKTNEQIMGLFRDLYHIKKPHARMMSRHNDISPFENCVPLEILANKFDSSMFMFASHNKKRPNNLVLGRLNDHHVLDMIELGLVSYQGMSTFKNEKVSFGIKPCLLFAGDLFESNLDYSRLQNLLVDLFQRQKVEKIRLQGLEHVIMFTATDNNKILMRSYKINLKKSGVKTPLVELEEIGPRADFIVRRSQIASEDLYRMAFKKPKILKIRKTKNISRDVFGNKHGRIHMKSQSVDKMPIHKRLKGLKRKASERNAIKKQKLADGTAAPTTASTDTPATSST